MDIFNPTVLKSALNAFIISAMTQFLNSGASIFNVQTEDLKTLLNSAVVSAAWVVFRYVNPKGSMFGYVSEGHDGHAPVGSEEPSADSSEEE